MKKNILLLCMDGNLSASLAEKLSNKLEMHFLDIDKLIDFEIINREQVSLRCGNEYLKKLEFDCVSRASTFENSVACLSVDFFVGNDAQGLFDNFVKIFVVIDKLDAKSPSECDKNFVFKEISDYMTNNCDHVLSYDGLSVDKLVDKILSLLR